MRIVGFVDQGQGLAEAGQVVELAILDRRTNFIVRDQFQSSGREGNLRTHIGILAGRAAAPIGIFRHRSVSVEGEGASPLAST